MHMGSVPLTNQNDLNSDVAPVVRARVHTTTSSAFLLAIGALESSSTVLGGFLPFLARFGFCDFASFALLKEYCNLL